MTETVLQEAERLINGDRQQTYGDASESFNLIGALWGAYLGAEVSGLDVANLMILLKVSRTKGQFHRDSYVDIGGYAGLGERLHLESEVIDAEVVEPRVWQSLADVPNGATVECFKSGKEQSELLKVKIDDTGAAHYKWDFQEEWSRWWEPGERAHADRSYGPFREVL